MFGINNKYFPGFLLAAAVFFSGCESKPDNSEIGFEFRYQVVFTEPGQLKAWIPVPQNDVFQTISNLRIESNLTYRTLYDSVYHNRFVVVDGVVGETPDTLVITFDVLRKEAGIDTTNSEPDYLKIFMSPFKMVPNDQRFKNIADSLDSDGESFVRRVYEYVLDNMIYDKSGEGWGRGDAIYACEIGKGNCTDYHSLFNAIVRARGIPARFHIGFPLPSENAGNIKGYHCWTDFHIPGRGWIPVDISEADKHPGKRNYYYGTLDNRRVDFTIGRDIPLPEGTAEDVVNYIIFPYVKLNGNPREAYLSTISFREFPDRRKLSE
ncbi:MAG: transglutaminase domain-containing protein [FCB group bacterium]|nr:transglutaminase domain-containing protein [FCB group bacterium]